MCAHVAVGVAHVSVIRMVVGFCCGTYFIMNLWVCVPAFVCVLKKNELFVKTLPLVLTHLRLCVSVCIYQCLVIALSAGDGNLSCPQRQLQLGIMVLHRLRVADSLTAVHR